MRVIMRQRACRETVQIAAFARETMGIHCTLNIFVMSLIWWLFAGCRRLSTGGLSGYHMVIGRVGVVKTGDGRVLDGDLQA